MHCIVCFLCLLCSSLFISFRWEQQLHGNRRSLLRASRQQRGLRWSPTSEVDDTQFVRLHFVDWNGKMGWEKTRSIIDSHDLCTISFSFPYEVTWYVPPSRNCNLYRRYGLGRISVPQYLSLVEVGGQGVTGTTGVYQAAAAAGVAGLSSWASLGGLAKEMGPSNAPLSLLRIFRKHQQRLQDMAWESSRLQLSKFNFDDVTPTVKKIVLI